jgi:hypothetical protein
MLHTTPPSCGARHVAAHRQAAAGLLLFPGRRYGGHSRTPEVAPHATRDTSFAVSASATSHEPLQMPRACRCQQQQQPWQPTMVAGFQQQWCVQTCLIATQGHASVWCSSSLLAAFPVFLVACSFRHAQHVFPFLAHYCTHQSGSLLVSRGQQCWRMWLETPGA